MLEELNITNLGIVENTSLSFAKGLNVLTGETGAGKSMILNGLGLLLGSRAKTSLIGAGKQQLTVEGCWEFSEPPAFIDELNATVEDGQLFVSRTVKADGKSRAVIGGRSLPVSVLAELSSNLVSIHGQSDQLKLKSNSTQLKIVDDYGPESLSALKEEYKSLYSRWVEVKKLLAEYRETASLKLKEKEFYEEVVEDFSKVDPQEGEDEALRQQINKLENIDVIREHLQVANHAMSNDEDENDLLTLFYMLDKSVTSASKLDEDLSEIQERVSRLQGEMHDLNHEIGSYLSNVDYEAISSLHEAQERLNQIVRLNRKYDQVSLSDSLEFYRKAVEWLEKNSSFGSIESLTEEHDKVFGLMDAKGKELTAVRISTAVKLSEEMNKALAELNMSGAVFLIETYESDHSSSGKDIVEFMLKAHKNADPQPINKTASGGELSRIMLALETVTANTDTLTTFVFDEVDSGVGGEAAVQIGKRLAELAKHAQVIVVTHLPQVACFADNHLLIKKESTDVSTLTTVDRLTEDERRGEIARMLSGLNDSETGLAHADELLQFAHEWKNA